MLPFPFAGQEGDSKLENRNSKSWAGEPKPINCIYFKVLQIISGQIHGENEWPACAPIPELMESRGFSKAIEAKLETRNWKQGFGKRETAVTSGSSMNRIEVPTSAGMMKKSGRGCHPDPATAGSA